MKNYVVLDFETTGLDPLEEQVIEVALQKLDGELQEVGSFNTFVKLENGCGLTDFIKDYTGITEKDLMYGMTETEAMEVIRSFIDEDTVVVAQYAPFDLAFMHPYAIQPKKYICTKALTNQAEPLESASLKHTCERLGIKLDQAHRAFADVQATVELLKVRLNQNLEYVENVIVEDFERALTFVPENTFKILLRKDLEEKAMEQ